MKIQQIRVGNGSKPGRYLVRMNLVRTVRPEDVVTGSLALTAEGNKADGQAGMVDLGALTGGKVRELPFNFRYFQNFRAGNRDSGGLRA